MNIYITEPLPKANSQANKNVDFIVGHAQITSLDCFSCSGEKGNITGVSDDE